MSCDYLITIYCSTRLYTEFNLFSVNFKVLIYLRSPNWDTRIAAGQAVEAIMKNIPDWDPTPKPKRGEFLCLLVENISLLLLQLGWASSRKYYFFWGGWVRSLEQWCNQCVSWNVDLIMGNKWKMYNQGVPFHFSGLLHWTQLSRHNYVSLLFDSACIESFALLFCETRSHMRFFCLVPNISCEGLYHYFEKAYVLFTQWCKTSDNVQACFWLKALVWMWLQLY